MEKELVSVLIPTYNRAHYLFRAIDSCLEQSYRPIEILVSDNCSTDDTRFVVESRVATAPNVVFYKKNTRNIGAVRNWKRAYESSRGKFIALLSDDDYFTNRDYLRDAATILRGSPKTNLVICNAQIGNAEPGLPGVVPGAESVKGDVFLNNFWSGEFQIPCITNVFRRGSIPREMFWEDEHCLYSDIELWLKLMVTGDVAVIGKPSVFYRFHASNAVHAMNVVQLIKNADYLKRVYRFYEENTGRGEPGLMRTLTNRYIEFVRTNFKEIDVDALARGISERLPTL